MFSELQLNNELHRAFESAMVSKVSTNPNKDRVRIYLSFDGLVPKNYVLKVTKEIKKQIFKQDGISVHIIEDFKLSEAYNPKNFYESYRDSILEEFNEIDIILLNVYRNANITFPDDNHILITLDDNLLARTNESTIVDRLYKIFNERCHFDVEISVEYKEHVTSKLYERSSMEIANRIAQISARAAGHNDEDGLVEDEPVAKDNAKNSSSEVKSSQAPSEAKHEAKPKADSSPKLTAKPEIKRKSFKSDNPDVLYGREFVDEAVNISSIEEYIGGEATVRGVITALEWKTTKSEKGLFICAITDYTDSIKFKLFIDGDEVSEYSSHFKEGDHIKIKGLVDEDKYDKEISMSRIYGIMKIPAFETVRMDNAAEKRVELHCHSKMSDFDGVSEITDIIKRAKKWGHKALAITDHGVVQAFTDADHLCEKDPDFKVLYGCEGYVVDDTRLMANNSKGQSLDDTYVVFDIETTGFNAKDDRIIEIGAVKITGGQIVDKFSEFVNPGMPIPFRIRELTSIKDEDVAPADPIEQVLPRFINFVGTAAVVAHNADFDVTFIKENAKRLSLEFDPTYVDTMLISQFLLTQIAKHTLDAVAKALNVVLDDHHRAVADAQCTAEIFIKMCDKLKAMNIHDLDKLNSESEYSADAIKKSRSNHIILIAKNDLGRINLYRLVSASHTDYFSRNPRMPKSLINKYREGLIIGSACEAGELYQAIIGHKSDAEISRIVQFYDYLEIQPNGNNHFMLVSDRFPDINTEDDLRAINKKIVALGEQFNKPVVATCDVHFLDPEDEVYRRIIMANKGFDDADDQAPLYLHTTEEMLEEFAYLGIQKAHEVVIDNTNLIADMCDKIRPVRPDKCPPVIEDSDKTLRKICYDKAHAMYGPELPEVVVERLERELNSIIGNGYAVMYIIAQKLVWKSVEDGYLVGSRGSVGSSFVATMAGITEVNPLSAHYLCPECHYVDFDSDFVKSFSGRGGCDMPDKDCPKCGKKLEKHGFDIPFETFLGFEGDKEPDIDLNFSGDYQSKAHRYTEVIFGEGQTFKAGTVSTVADNTAYGFVKKYFEKRDDPKRTCEIERLLKGCMGVKSTTGQHPGGIIVLPVGEDINSFTPVQHPANKDTDIVTTHFDYHSIDMNLLKLDILGHDDPTMIRMLEDLIQFDATKIPLDDKGVMSLFMNTSALGVMPEDLMGTKLGTLGIPEFGTDFAMQMLIDAKPTEFTDLVRIAGLAHGTDVWLGNAQDLILSGQCTISSAICCRDDIMVYLISMGVDPAESFKIMEDVRKGKVAKGKCDKWDKYKEDMRACNVPEWYIGSCEKIKYMFPKAHAVAYVMMAWRVAYCKIYHPLEFYAAFFSIRAKGFDYKMMCLGREKCEMHIKQYKAMGKSAMSATDDNVLKALRIVQEFYARGFEFLPINLYESDARYFKIVDGKLLPPFNIISGMGDQAAESLSIAASFGKFLSLDDIRERGKVSQTILDDMVEMEIIKDLPKSNQISIFDFV